MRQAILFLHIFIAMTWVGGVLFIGWGVLPSIRSFTFKLQRKVLIAIMKWAHPILLLAGLFTIITGVLLGTIFGPLITVETILHTSYGKRWMLALGIGIGTLGWGTFVGYYLMNRLLMTPFYWKEAEYGNPSVLYREKIRLMIFESIEVIGFIILLFLMISF